MSLSKYYKNSDSFKREEIVKQDSSEIKGWKPLPQQDRQPFKTESITERIKDRFNQDRQEAQFPAKDRRQHSAGTDASSVEPGSDTVSPPLNSGTPQVPPESNLPDPSQYIKITDVSQQIEDAYQQGIIDGEDKVVDDYGVAAKLLLNVCQQLDSIKETIISNSSSELQNFAIAIAEKIIRTSVVNQDHTIVATIEEALQRAVRSDEFTIFINPEDYDIVVSKSSELVGNISGLTNIVIKQDSTIERGGAKIESDNCTIDATIASQFDIIHEEVKRIR